MIGSIIHQLTRNLTADEVKAAGFDAYFVDHGLGVYPASAAGVPFSAAYLQSKGDCIADLVEDLAAEQKARATYDNILRLSDDPDVNDVIRFLRQREVVHFQRFGDVLRKTQESLDRKNYYAYNPTETLRCRKMR
jgi:spore coat protein JC